MSDKENKATFWFKRECDHYDMESTLSDLRWKRVIGIPFAAMFAAVTGCSSAYVNEAREASLEVQFGQVVDQEDTAGLKFKTPFIASRYSYSLARQTTKLEQMTGVRTGDDIKLNIGITVDWEIQQDADIAKLYFDLQDQGGDIENVINVRARDAVVRVMEAMTIEDILADEGTQEIPGAEGEEVTTSSANGSSFIGQLKSNIAEELQNELSGQGWPINIIGVYSEGYTFSAKSEARLEQIVNIRQEKVRLRLRQENALDAEEVYATEAQADAVYIQGLIDAGMPRADIAQALCLKMNRDADRVNAAFSSSCSDSGANGAAIIDRRRKSPAP